MSPANNISPNSEDQSLQASNEGEKNLNKKIVERVGVLLVHGIGKQKQFEHLREVAIKIIKSLRSPVNAELSYKVETIVRTSSNGAFLATEKTWITDPSPVTLRITDSLGQIIDIDIHEVWWADLADNSGLTFWWWALSLWARKGYFENRKIDSENRMRRPTKYKRSTPVIMFHERLIMLGMSFIALVFMPIPAVISRFLGALGFRPPINIISQYMNQVRIFSQNRRDANNQLIDNEHPPRVSIRRRMINAMVQMALNNYDRWYILAHSQGTVLAFNGIMESEQTLPNYLDESTWGKVKKAGFCQDEKTVKEADEAKGFMRPTRPTFLESKDLIDRRKIFTKLNGLLTYGSPLDKFAIVWPAIVSINKDESVFNPLFQWINVFDPTDPVASQASFFEPHSSNIQTGTTKSPKPINISYKSSWWHLISHRTYLDNSTKSRRLIDDITQWFILGSQFPENPEWKIRRWGRYYSFLRLIIWCFLALIGSLFIAWVPVILGWENLIIELIVTPLITLFSHFYLHYTNYWWYQALENPMSYIVNYSLIATFIIGSIGFIIVFVIGLIEIFKNYLQESDSNFIKEDILNLLQINSKAFCLSQITNKLYGNDSEKMADVQKVLEKMVKDEIIRKEELDSCHQADAIDDSCHQAKDSGSNYSYYFYPITEFKLLRGNSISMYKSLDFAMELEMQKKLRKKLWYNPELERNYDDGDINVKITGSEESLDKKIRNDFDLKDNQEIFALVTSNFEIWYILELGRITGLQKDITETVTIIYIEVYSK